MLVANIMVVGKKMSLEQFEVTFLVRKEFKHEKRKYDKFKAFFVHFHKYCSESDLSKETWTDWASKNQILDTLLSDIPKNKEEKVKMKEAKKAKKEV